MSTWHFGLTQVSGTLPNRRGDVCRGGEEGRAEWAMAAGEPLSWSRRLDYKRMPPIDQCNGRTMAGTLVARLRAGISRELGAHPPHLTSPCLFSLGSFVMVPSRMNHSVRRLTFLLMMFDQLNHQPHSGVDRKITDNI